MDVTVVIPAHNEERYIGPCIQSILDHRTPRLAEIIVVDNASTDRTADVARGFPLARVVREEAKGVTHAREAGRRAARTPLVAYVDADSRIDAGWLEAIDRAFAAQPDLVCLSGPCNYYDFPPWKRRIVDAYWRYLALPAYFFSRAMVLGSNFAARAAALEAIGGFDTSIAFYGDDTNIARRLKRQGTVTFTLSLCVQTSARRLKNQGLLSTGTLYVLNYLSESFLHRPVTRSYRDIR